MPPLRGTRNRGFLWRWLGNVAENQYLVPDQITPVVDATKSYPLTYLYKRVTATQAAVGPATTILETGPPPGKSWFVERAAVAFNPARANAILEFLVIPRNGLGSDSMKLMSAFNTNFFTQDDSPVGFAANAGTAAITITRQLNLYMAGAPFTAVNYPLTQGVAFDEILRLQITNALQNDTLDLTLRYLEQDLDVPPGG